MISHGSTVRNSGSLPKNQAVPVGCSGVAVLLSIALSNDQVMTWAPLGKSANERHHVCSWRFLRFVSPFAQGLHDYGAPAVVQSLKSPWCARPWSVRPSAWPRCAHRGHASPVPIVRRPRFLRNLRCQRPGPRRAALFRWTATPRRDHRTEGSNRELPGGTGYKSLRVSVTSSWRRDLEITHRHSVAPAS